MKIETVTQQVQRTLEGAGKRLTTALGGATPKPVLTPDQQLDRFLKLSKADYEVLRQRHGDAAFQRYLARMQTIAEGNNARQL